MNMLHPLKNIEILVLDQENENRAIGLFIQLAGRK